MGRDFIVKKLTQKQLQYKLPFTEVHISVAEIGKDYHILIGGGDVYHIGCTVLAVPRPSLSGDGSVSSTSSVLNRSGHKDELVCRSIAETVAARKNAAVACTGGIHLEQITPEQIEMLQNGVKEMISLILAAIE